MASNCLHTRLLFSKTGCWIVFFKLFFLNINVYLLGSRSLRRDNGINGGKLRNPGLRLWSSPDTLTSSAQRMQVIRVYFFVVNFVGVRHF